MNIEKIYIIHYTKLTERKKNILSFIDNFKSPYQFIEEGDPESFSQIALKGVYEPDSQLWNQKVSKLWDEKAHAFRVLNNGEISCTIKNLLAIRRVAKECNSCGLIIEDDCIPRDREIFQEKLQLLIENAPENWDVIFLGAGCGEDFINNKIKDKALKVRNGLVRPPHPASNCTEAYIVTPAAAEKIYKACLPFQLVIDWELSVCFYNLNLNIYWAAPPIFYQGSKDGTFQSFLR